MLVFLIIVLLFTRLYALFTVGRVFYQFEGLWRGWMAKELLDGAGWGSIFNNPFFSAEGGSVVTGYLAALFFSIFGDNFFSLTLVPIVFSLLILITFYLFLSRYFNRPTAIIFSFLFIFPPVEFFRYSLVALGYHFESVLFSILGLFCFFEIFFNESNYKIYLEKSSKLSLLFMGFGLISGLGIYFFYTYLIMLLTIILFWFLFDKRFFLKRYFYIFLLGVIIGLLPWLIYNTLHNFAGLNIQGRWTPFEVIFSRNILQIFQAFVRIVTEKLPEFLGKNFYLTILFSFGLIIFLNLNSFRQILRSLLTPQAKYMHNMKELVFIGYVLVFISTWSILHMPSASKDAPPLSELAGRLFHFYPFLFVLVALCFNRFLPLKKDKIYLLRMALVIAMAIWIIGIGFLDYSAVTSVGNKIEPLKIKGYSVRLPYIHGEKNIVSFLDRDMARLREATNYDGRLWEFFANDIYFYSLYADNGLLQELANDSQLEEAKKPYYYLLVGLNTGDFTEGYNILNLKKLIAQKVPLRYRHYLYEGIAISLMERRYRELMENIDFINKVPIEYRHYFLLELGRIIGVNLDDRRKRETLTHVTKQFSPHALEYIYQGILKSVIADTLLKVPQEPDTEKYLAELHSWVSRRLLVFLQDNNFSAWFKDNNIEDKIKKYVCYGLIESMFKEDTVYQEKEIKTKIKEVIAHNRMEQKTFYEGLGLSLGHFAFGNIHTFAKFINPSIIEGVYLPYIWNGYGMSLVERYGNRTFYLMRN